MSNQVSRRARFLRVIRYAVVAPSIVMVLNSFAIGDESWYRERAGVRYGFAGNASKTSSTPIPATASHAIIYDKAGVPLDAETLIVCNTAPGEQCTFDRQQMMLEASRRLLYADWANSWCGKMGAKKPQAQAGNLGSWVPDATSYLSLISPLGEAPSLQTKRIPKDAWSALYFATAGDEAVAVECLIAPGGTHLVRETFTLLEGKQSISPGTPAPCTTPPFLCSYFYKNVEYCRRC